MNADRELRDSSGGSKSDNQSDIKVTSASGGL